LARPAYPRSLVAAAYIAKRTIDSHYTQTGRKEIAAMQADILGAHVLDRKRQTFLVPALLKKCAQFVGAIGHSVRMHRRRNYETCEKGS
jgi:hypothetical protein